MNYNKLFEDVRDKDLEISLRVDALERLLDIANNLKHKDCFNANKLLLQGGWVSEDNNNTRGRPSKEAIRAEVSRLANLEKQYKEDLERINNE